MNEKMSLFMKIASFYNWYSTQERILENVESSINNSSDFIKNMNKESLEMEKRKLNSFKKFIEEDYQKLIADGSLGDKSFETFLEVKELLAIYNDKESVLEHIEYTENKDVMRFFKEALGGNADKIGVGLEKMREEISLKFEQLTGEEFDFTNPRLLVFNNINRNKLKRK